jgi:hypothetical protein
MRQLKTKDYCKKAILDITDPLKSFDFSWLFYK